MTPAEHIIPPDTWLYSKDERKQLLYSVCNRVSSNFVKFRYVEDNADVEEDSVTEYAKQLLSVGLFYFQYRDAVKEGDGGRVLRCWKYLLPLFFNSRRDSKEALLLLCQHKYLLPPRQAKQLLYSRFVNTKGQKRKNIECDLHMEHLNRVCKDAIRDLGPNKTAKSIMRAAKAHSTNNPVISQNSIDKQSGSHKKAKCVEDIKIIVHDLVKYKVFSPQGRKPHSSFSKMKCLLHCREKETLLQYMEQNMPQ